MTAAGFFLRVSLFALLTAATWGFPTKGSKSAGQSSSGTRAAGNFGSYQGAAAGRPVTVPYTASSDVYMATPVQASGLSQPVLQADPRLSGYGSFVPTQLVVQAPGFVQAPGLVQGALQADPRFSSSGSVVPVQMAVQASGVPQAVQTGPALSSLSSGLPATGYSTVTYVPVDVGSDAGALQPGAAQSGPQETQWAIAPSVFEDASAQALSLTDVLPAAPLSPPGPVLQSGETSSVTKEAELGNYQQQTEEFGYPDDRQGSGPGSATVLVPRFGVGGSPDFDYRLLYGLYPSGTYSTFSQQHEKGKDYFQDVHYLKEHITDSHGSGQQKKFFPSAR